MTTIERRLQALEEEGAMTAPHLIFVTFKSARPTPARRHSVKYTDREYVQDDGETVDAFIDRVDQSVRSVTNAPTGPALLFVVG